jgi:hypothetical protein
VILTNSSAPPHRPQCSKILYGIQFAQAGIRLTLLAELGATWCDPLNQQKVEWAHPDDHPIELGTFTRSRRITALELGLARQIRQGRKIRSLDTCPVLFRSC